jgi:hypothetical protein
MEYVYVLDCVACFPKARLISPTPTAITTVAVFLIRSLSTTVLIAVQID